MLGKLLKYDLKYMLKNMSIFYILALFFSFTTRILFSLKETTIINILGQISVGFMFSMIGSIIFNTIIRSWVRFRDSLYKDESYLTHTLPVTKGNLYESRFLQSLLFSVFGFIVSVGSLFIAYFTDERWLLVKNTINSISIGYNLNAWFVIISIIIIFFLEIFNIIQSGFFGIIKGNKFNNNKITYSFVFGFISYLASQAVIILLLFMVGIFNKDIMSIFNSTILISSDLLKFLIALCITFYIIVIFIMNTICKKELEKGVNIE